MTRRRRAAPAARAATAPAPERARRIPILAWASLAAIPPVCLIVGAMAIALNVVFW